MYGKSRYYSHLNVDQIVHLNVLLCAAIAIMATMTDRISTKIRGYCTLNTRGVRAHRVTDLKKSCLLIKPAIGGE
jgi:hypothetical protein